MASANPSAAERHAGLVDAIDRASNDLGLFDPEHKFDRDISIRDRRRGGRNEVEGPVGTLTLVDAEGVLYWRNGLVKSAGMARRGRRAAPLMAEEEIVMQRRFEMLPPDKINSTLQGLDTRFLKREPGLRRLQNGRLVSAKPAVYSGRTLLLVHGTFSNSDNLIEEFRSTAEGRDFLRKAQNDYTQVLFFDHPTLAVGPLMNAIDLSRALAGSTHELDIIAHSRGGVVVRWFLEQLGNGAGPKPRAVLVGAPLAGTSLAAGPSIRGSIDLLTNFGSALERFMGLGAAANPFLVAPAALLHIFVSVTGIAANLPVADAAVAMVPGLFGQAAISNNGELLRLRTGSPVVRAEYFAVRSNFEPKSEGWKFWRYFRKTTMLDPLADAVFNGENDLVVDTVSMTDFGKNISIKAEENFETSADVHHCNYFRQKRTIDFIAKSFPIPQKSPSRRRRKA